MDPLYDVAQGQVSFLKKDNINLIIFNEIWSDTENETMNIGMLT